MGVGEAGGEGKWAAGGRGAWEVGAQHSRQAGPAAAAAAAGAARPCALPIRQVGLGGRPAAGRPAGRTNTIQARHPTPLTGLCGVLAGPLAALCGPPPLPTHTYHTYRTYHTYHHHHPAPLPGPWAMAGALAALCPLPWLPSALCPLPPPAFAYLHDVCHEERDGVRLGRLKGVLRVQPRQLGAVALWRRLCSNSNQSWQGGGVGDQGGWVEEWGTARPAWRSSGRVAHCQGWAREELWLG